MERAFRAAACKVYEEVIIKYLPTVHIAVATLSVGFVVGKFIMCVLDFLIPRCQTIVAIARVKKVVIESKSISDSCAVCLEEFELGTEAMALNCTHKYHKKCIFRWLKISRSCPLCRFQVA